MTETSPILVIALTLHEAQTATDADGNALAPDELERLQQLAGSTQREHFRARRGALRHVLGRLANCAPEDVRFGYGAYGKPHITGPSTAKHIGFSTSWCSNAILIAVANTRWVGVDIEPIESRIDAPSVAEGFFQTPELWLTMDANAIRIAALDWLVQMEALYKASGLGLGAGLGERQPPRRFTVQRIDVGDAYSAAVSAEGTQWRAVVTDLTSLSPFHP